MIRRNAILMLAGLAIALALPITTGNALADDCRVTVSKPIYDNNSGQYYVSIDNGCSFAVQVTVRNGGVDYGKYCTSGQKGLRCDVGRTLHNDYKVTIKKAAGS